MPEFSVSSNAKLNECTGNLQQLFREVVRHMDCAVTCGHRGQADQDAAYAAGKSKVRYPNGMHNSVPSKAVDVYPYVNGRLSDKTAQCCYLAGYVMATADRLGIKIRWGGDWDMDTEALTDQQLQDLVHFEEV